MTESTITLRPVSASDDEFLCELYCDTRRLEVAAFGWKSEQAEAFLRMQFSARHLAYKMQFPSAVQKVIEFGDRSAGSLIVERSTKRIFLIDIAIARQFQGKGIGTDLIRRLQDEAAGSAIPLMLHADKANLNAFNLYKKLAFKVTGETLVLYEMAWSASGK